jgi:hypothetical protein
MENLRNRMSVQGVFPTCWFHSILNGFLITNQGRLLLNYMLQKYKSSHELLPLEDKIRNLSGKPKGCVNFSINFFFTILEWVLKINPSLIRNVASNNLLKMINKNVRENIRNVNSGSTNIFKDLLNFLRRIRLIDHVIFHDINDKKFIVQKDDPLLLINYNLEGTYYDVKAKSTNFKGKRYNLNCVYFELKNTRNRKASSHLITGIIENNKCYIVDSNGIIFECDWLKNPNSILQVYKNIGMYNFDFVQTRVVTFIRSDIDKIKTIKLHKTRYSVNRKKVSVSVSLKNPIKVKKRASSVSKYSLGIGSVYRETRSANGRLVSTPNKVINK